MQAVLNELYPLLRRSALWGLTLWYTTVEIACHSQVLTETEAVRQALAANFQIRVARTEAQVAREGNTWGFAGALPQVTANLNPNLTVANQSLEFVSGETRSATGALTTNLGANIQLNWTLFDGFNMFATKDLLNLGVVGSELQARARVEAVVAEVYTVYAQLLALQQLQEVTREALAYSRLRVLISEAKERIGTEPGLNTLQARVDINADSTRLLQQNLEIEQLKAQLNRLMGRAPETPFTVVPPEPTVKAYSYDRLRATLESRNTDLLQAANRYREAQARLRQAESLNYPSLGLFTNLNYNRQQAQVGILSQSQSFGPQVGLTASWVLYDGRTLKRREAQARLNTTVAEWSQADLRLQAATELHQAYDRYQTAAAIIAVETQNIELLAQTAEAALAQFRIGVLNDLELRQTQLKVVDARGRLVQAQLTQRLAEIELNRLCGEFGYGS